MTQDEIIEMAEQAGMVYMDYIRVDSMEQIERLVNLVAAKATEEANAKANASWTLMCKKMVAIEREACAKVCEERFEKHTWEGSYADECAQAIRARGEQT
jgi:predicted nucleotidyltransferase